jgi:hypothetical protein
MQRIRIRFPEQESKRRAVGYLPGRFSFTSHASGEMLIPEAALAALASEGIPFIVEETAAYEDDLADDAWREAGKRRFPEAYDDEDAAYDDL